MRNWTLDIAALLLRVAGGLIFLPHGWSKISSAGGAGEFAADIAANYGIPAVFGHAAAWAELVGAALLIVGLLTRLDALLLACTMSVAAFVVLLPDALYEVPAGSIKLFVVLRAIELPLSLLAICLALTLIGGGKFSIDYLLRLDERFRLRGKKKAAAEAAA